MESIYFQAIRSIRLVLVDEPVLTLKLKQYFLSPLLYDALIIVIGSKDSYRGDSLI